MNKYNPKEIEAKWQKYWEEEKTFAVGEDSKKSKFYGLIEFPYPSGAGLHVGHPRPFMAMDVICRKRRMEGYNVLFPIGFDAFGLPTENFAIKMGRKPVEVTAENIATFTRQLKSLGFSFDWSRVVDTTDPAYYKWTQWIFLQLFKHGLAYKKKQPINWCPKDKIGLANEEVVDGACERCGTPVEKREKEQWMLAITKYAESLLQGLDTVDYIERAKTQQRNWIGRSEGAVIKFEIAYDTDDANSYANDANHANVANSVDFAVGGKKNKRSNELSEAKFVEVFTTRPDTIFGATYLVVAPEHSIVKNLEPACRRGRSRILNLDEVNVYVENAKRKSDMERSAVDKEKSGVELKGIKAINPANRKPIPIWVADYVLGSYGTGAIMAVPAHDERDWEFARKFGLLIKQVVAPYISSTNFKVRDDKPTNTRQVVTVIIRQKETGKYLLQDMADGRRGFTGGGVEEGESFEQAVKREVAEETGYSKIKILKPIIEVWGHAFKPKRDYNCSDPDAVFLVEVEGNPTSEISEEDKNAHEIVWKDESEVLDFINLDHHLFIWNYYLAGKGCFTENGISIHSEFITALKTSEAKEKIIQWLEEKGVGKRQVQYKLRDWVFSRQRYWGEPIPLVFCEACADWIPLPEDELPLKLPEVEKYQPTDTGESPLAAMTDWVNVKCPRCGGKARRETDTMPNWAGSSWYFLRYADPTNDAMLASTNKLKYWMPIDWYNGGMEHTVLHLLYSRFWNQFLYDIGVVPVKEPYAKRTSHGMILAKGGEKMSKSRGNVVNPDEIVNEFGADALRTYIMFMGPFDQAVEWDANGLVGVRRFLDRVWNLQSKVDGQTVPALERRGATSESTGGRAGVVDSSITSTLHQTIKKVTEDIEAMRFNTAIAKLMELTNEMYKVDHISSITYHLLLKLLFPFAPHMCEELWSASGGEGDIAFVEWPTYDPALIVFDTMTIAVQVNGKLRATVEVSSDESEDTIKSTALALENVQKWLEGKEPKKVIYVKGKLVSVVV